MKQHIVGSSCVVLMFAVAAAGQIQSQAPSQAPVTSGIGATSQQAPAPTARRTQTAEQVTVAGCVTPESQASGARGGVLNTGAGSGNEFVLAKVTSSSDTTPSSGASSTGTSYSLTGNREGEFSGLVGQRVEIVGTLEGTRAGMRELNIASFKAKGPCETAK